VIAGLDRDEIGLLLFTGTACGDDVLARVARALRDHNEENPNGSRRVGRVLVMTEPPSIDAGEVTDKGYINQRAVLARRADLVERLYRGEGDDVVVGL
jgi:feruloyl-CoA synthase